MIWDINQGMVWIHLQQAKTTMVKILIIHQEPQQKELKNKRRKLNWLFGMLSARNMIQTNTRMHHS